MIKVVFLLALSLAICFSTKTHAAQDNERLKLEIEKLKLENEKLKLSSAQRVAAVGPLDDCLAKKNTDKCWDYFNSDEETKKPEFRTNVSKIRDLFAPSCKLGSENSCSLVSKINYKVFQDPTSITMMEKYLKFVPTSNRRYDLISYYSGTGEIINKQPDARKVEELALGCLTSKTEDLCVSVAADILFNSELPDGDARRIGFKIYDRGKNSSDVKVEVKKIMDAFESCKLEFTDTKRFTVSANAVRKWVSVKNKGLEPIEFYADIQGLNSKQGDVVFTANFLPQGQIQPNGSYSEEILFLIPTESAQAANDFYKDFELKGVKLSTLKFRGEVTTAKLPRMCEISTSWSRNPEKKSAVAESVNVQPVPSQSVIGYAGWKLGDKVDTKSSECKVGESELCSIQGTTGNFKGAASVLICGLNAKRFEEPGGRLNICASKLSGTIYKINVKTDTISTDARQLAIMKDSFVKRYGPPSKIAKVAGEDRVLSWYNGPITFALVPIPKTNVLLQFIDLKSEDVAISEMTKQ